MHCRWFLFLLAAIPGLMLWTTSQGATDTVRPYLERSDDWFRTDEATRIAANVLSWQANEGGWPKNTDTTKPFGGERAKLQGTFDNSATTDELRFLARMLGASDFGPAQSYSNAFARGLDYILKAQYTNGGWPQYAPPPANKYHRHITFNDNSIARLMIFLREVATEKRYGFVGQRQRLAAQRAFDRGVGCILRCQITVNGKLTAWCAQHDEIDFSPRPARTYELASLSGSESVGIVRLLMSLEQPSPEVIRAVDAAAAWLESAKLPGLKVEQITDKNSPEGTDKVVVKDTNARPMWARFYDIETGQAIFAGRDGVKKYSLAEIEYERRDGYSWLGYWPEALLVKEYPAWKAKVAAKAN